MTEEPPEAIRKTRKRWLWGAALILALFLVACVSQRISGWWKLSRLKAELREQGEILDVKELAGAPIPESENCAADLDNLLADLAVVPGTDWQNPTWVSPKPMDHSVTNGWRVVWRQARLPHEDINDKVTYFSWEALVKAVEPARPYLDEIPRLIGTKRYESAFYDQGMEAAAEMLRFMNLRAADKWLLRASLLAMHEGDRATARQHAEALLDLIRITENERLMITQLIRDAMGNRAVALIWELLADKEWDDPALMSLQERCAAMRFVEPMIAAVEMERAMTVNEFHRYRASDDAWDDAVASMNELESFMGSSSLGGFYRSRYHRFAWRLMWSDMDEYRALAQWNAFVGVFRESVASWGSRETRERLEALSSGETAWFGVIDESEELDFMDAARYCQILWMRAGERRAHPDGLVSLRDLLLS